MKETLLIKSFTENYPLIAKDMPDHELLQSQVKNRTGPLNDWL
jgi:hypothetical protein